MGFELDKCKAAIKEAKGNTDEALNLILLNMDNPNYGKEKTLNEELY
jgi:hypothetical protein